MGRPAGLRYFPSEEEDPNYYKKNIPRSIPISEIKYNEYVTSYEVHGRVEGGNWIYMGKYNGNTDCTTEVINDISLYVVDGFHPKYLKITPLGYHGEKSMRIMLYGDVDSNITDNNDTHTEIVYKIITSNNDKFRRCDMYYLYKDDRIKYNRPTRLNLKDLCRTNKVSYNNKKNQYIDNNY
jgi:hypothetical protein